MARAKSVVTPDAADAAENTQQLGDQSPKFAKLTEADQVHLLLGAPEYASLPDHPLDLAPKNSKVIVMKKIEGAGRIAVLATPSGPVGLAVDDRAHILPEGSKIYKADDGNFVLRLPEEYEYAAQPVSGRAAELISAAVDAILQGDRGRG